jgi:hypothetical protein
LSAKEGRIYEARMGGLKPGGWYRLDVEAQMRGVGGRDEPSKVEYRTLWAQTRREC